MSKIFSVATLLLCMNLFITGCQPASDDNGSGPDSEDATPGEHEDEGSNGPALAPGDADAGDEPAGREGENPVPAEEERANPVPPKVEDVGGDVSDL